MNVDWFQIEIKNQRNIDCSFPEIMFITHQQEAYRIIGNNLGTYVALGLPKVNYPVGTTLFVKMRKPGSNEMVACTTLGTGWSQVYITGIK